MDERSKTMAESSPHLPHDVIFSNILSNLPVKSLYRFKSVSKLWNATISSDPYFIKSHLSWAKQNSTSSILGIFYRDVDQDTCEYIFIKEDCTELFRFQARKLKLKLNWLAGHCNGLFSFHSDSGFEICNPCTMDLLYLPLPLPLPPKIEYTSYGFGFDAFENEYKNVHIVHASRNDYRCMIYTLGGSSDNSWRDITIASHLSIQLNQCTLPHLDKPGPTVSRGIGLFLNGKLYWYFRRSSMFLAFDVHYEKFECFDGPGPKRTTFPKGVNPIVYLTEWRGCVCLAVKNLAGNEAQLYKYEMHRDWELIEVSKVLIRTYGTRSEFGSSAGEGLSYSLYNYIKLFTPEGQDEDGRFFYDPNSKMAKRFPRPVGLDGPERTDGLCVIAFAYTYARHFENVVSFKTMVQSGTSLVKYVKTMSGQVESVSSL